LLWRLRLLLQTTLLSLTLIKSMRNTKPKTTATDPEEVQAMAQDLIEDVETVKDHTEVVMKIAQTTI
jgi:hypothetical protein